MASTYLTRTPSTTGNRRTFTVSAWLKKSNTGSQRNIFGTAGGNDNGWFQIGFSSSDNIFVQRYTGNLLITDAKYRDVNAWYHLVLEVDTTQATDSDRLKLYVNGEQITDFSTETYPAQNFDTGINLNTEIHYVGRQGGNYFDGSMAHFHLIDGTAYDADTFGETDSTTGIWKPKTAPSVTYGTNGFFLKFENDSAFGTDSSGNDNDFTVNGTMTQTIDTPSNVFATMNPIITGGLSLSNGNLTGTTTINSQWVNMTSTLATSKGKYYFEVKKNDTIIFSPIIGITDAGKYGKTNYQKYAGVDANGFGFYYHGSDSVWRSVTNGTNSNFGSATPSASNGDIYMFAADLDNSYIYFGINGTWHNSGDPTSGSSGTGGISISSLSGKEVYFCATNSYNTSGTSTTNVNFGNGYFGTTAVSSAQNPDDGIGIFEYDVPTGYRALCTKSINAEEYD